MVAQVGGPGAGRGGSTLAQTEEGDTLSGAEQERRAGERAVASLRRARRDRRLGQGSRADLLYRAYLTVLVGGFLGALALEAFGDQPLGPATADRVLDEGPSWAGLGLALALVGAVRLGRRGGPLAVEEADLHHLLLAPVDRRVVLAGPAWRVIVTAMSVGAAVGGLAGLAAARRLPGAAPAWVAALGAFGATSGVLLAAAALLVSGRSLPHRVPPGSALVVVAWAVLDLAVSAVTAPTTVVARLAVPVGGPDPFALLAPPVAVALAFAAVARIGGLTLEVAARRTRLIGQLRFAATQFELRTVVLLRRQLTLEQHRSRPWFTVPGGGLARLPVAHRDLQSVARWPGARVARLLGLAAVTGAAMAGVWGGTTPLVLVAGLALFVAGLDTTEGLAQELDHPTRLRSLPRAEGRILSAHLAVPVLAMLGVAVLAAGVALVLRPDPLLGRVLLLWAGPAAALAVAGAAVSIAAEPTLDRSDEAVLAPEVAGPRLALRVGWPPAIAAFGGFPVFVARRVADTGVDPLPDVQTALVPVVVLAALVAGWLRFRHELRRPLGAFGGLS
jgi:hypothetical protein